MLRRGSRPPTQTLDTHIPPVQYLQPTRVAAGSRVVIAARPPARAGLFSFLSFVRIDCDGTRPSFFRFFRLFVHHERATRSQFGTDTDATDGASGLSQYISAGRPVVEIVSKTTRFDLTSDANAPSISDFSTL